jgi:lysozyme family protein
MKLNKTRSIVFILVSSFTFFNVHAASFEKYAPKLLKFEGIGYGIHKPLWGEKDFSRSEALRIHRQHYWNKYHGDLFVSQEVAEVFIDHIINAGPGKNGSNIKAFEAIIGAPQDGKLSVADVQRANSFYFPEQVVNPFVKYRVLYYTSRPDAAQYPGWITRAKAFLMNRDQNEGISDILLPINIENRFSYIKID